MTKNPDQTRWPDALVARVLLALPGEVAAICADTGLSPNMASAWRSRRQRRAVLMAAKLGLPHRDPRLSTWDAVGWGG